MQKSQGSRPWQGHKYVQAKLKGPNLFWGIFFRFCCFFFIFHNKEPDGGFQTVRSSWIPWPGSDWYSAVQCLGALSAQWPAVLCRWKIWSSVPGPFLNGFLPKTYIKKIPAKNQQVGIWHGSIAELSLKLTKELPIGTHGCAHVRAQWYLNKTLQVLECKN